MIFQSGTESTARRSASALPLVRLTIAAALLTAPPLGDAQGIITTVAGSTWKFPDSAKGGPAVDAPLRTVSGVAVDSFGNVYAADSGNNLIVKISPEGVLSVVAGNGVAAVLKGPGDVAIDGAGNLYIANTQSNVILKLDSRGLVHTVASNLNRPAGVALDAIGNVYIADTLNHRIRRVSATGVMTTVVGNGQAGFSGDGGPATSAQLNNPRGVAVDALGNIYVSDFLNNRIRKVDGSGTISTVAGSGQAGFSGDGGPATDAQLGHPWGIAIDTMGSLYVADFGNARIRKIDAAGTITTIAGGGNSGFGDGGSAMSAQVNNPWDVTVDAGGNIFIADSNNLRVRKVTPDGIITTIAGNGSADFFGDGGPATSAQLRVPDAVAVDVAGNIYVADTANNRIRKVDTAGTISTIAGTGQPGFSGDDGPATAARISRPRGIAVDAFGNLYIADVGNNRIRKVTHGIISTVAGTGEGGFSGDGGPALAARLLFPGAVAVDQARNLYIAESYSATFDNSQPPGNHRIRKMTSDGIISTVAGNGEDGFSGDGGPATSARLCFPEGIAVDAAGNLYITDSGNHRIRKVDLAGTITTVAGGGHSDPEGGFSGDGGPATRAALDLSTKDYVKSGGGTAVDTVGNLYIADIENGRIRKVSSTSSPVLSGNSVVNGASFTGPVAPGSIASVFGHFLAADIRSASSAPLPTELGGTSVTIAGIPAPLLYVSPSQINLQVPFEVPTGLVDFEVRTSRGIATSPLLVTPVSPGIFLLPYQYYDQGAILTSTGELAAPPDAIPGRPSRPARRGEIVSIYVTGLGDVTNRPATGAPPDGLSQTVLTPAVTIGGFGRFPATVSFSGLAPLFVGLYQVDVQVPSNAPTGVAVPLNLTIGGVTASAEFAVQ
jgi:uncharacterized protein (TIGR03437 family)